jgi:hypothetical protein
MKRVIEVFPEVLCNSVYILSVIYRVNGEDCLKMCIDLVPICRLMCDGVTVAGMV